MIFFMDLNGGVVAGDSDQEGGGRGGGRDSGNSAFSKSSFRNSTQNSNRNSGSDIVFQGRNSGDFHSVIPNQ